MKTLKIQNYLFGLVFLTLFACSPENLLINVKPAESQIVVASQLFPGDFMVVFLTRSFSALEGNEDTLSADFLEKIIVDDALVTITYLDRIDTLEQIDDTPGIYLSDTTGDIAFSDIRLEVFDPLTNQTVAATTTALPQLLPDSIAYLEEIVDEDTSYQFYYSFFDPAETNNWYIVNIFDPGRFANIVENDPLGLLGGGRDGNFHEAVISDQTIDENFYERTLNLQNPRKSDTLAFYFSNISEGYFRFLDARQRTGGIIASLTSEPVNLPTNVEGGLGYFNAQLPSISIVTKSLKETD